MPQADQEKEEHGVLQQQQEQQQQDQDQEQQQPGGECCSLRC